MQEKTPKLAMVSYITVLVPYLLALRNECNAIHNINGEPPAGMLQPEKFSVTLTTVLVT